MLNVRALLLLIVAAIVLAAQDADPAGDVAAADSTPKLVGALRGKLLLPGDSESSTGVILSDAVVFLRGDALDELEDDEEEPASDAEYTGPLLDQRDITFVPHVIPVVVGKTLRILNSDDILHNVHTSGKKNREFNRATLAHQTIDKKFKRPEVVHVGCDIHSQMSAYIVVVPNKFFAQAGADGTYEIPDVPAGEYTLVAWHEEFGELTTSVSVKAGGTSGVDIELTREANAKTSSH